jgi:hypothetical protein
MPFPSVLDDCKPFQNRGYEKILRLCAAPRLEPIANARSQPQILSQLEKLREPGS